MNGSQDDISGRIGEIKGMLVVIKETQERHTQALDHIDERMDKMESRVAIHSAGFGTVAAVAIGLAVEILKARLS